MSLAFSSLPDLHVLEDPFAAGVRYEDLAGRTTDLQLRKRYSRWASECFAELARREAA